MSKLLSIGTAVPAYAHRQEDILAFMQRVYAVTETDKRKLKFLYHTSGISTRYSVIPDYSMPVKAWKFYPRAEGLEPFPSLEQRMSWFNKYAASLSADAIRNCLGGANAEKTITHLITVSCTGMSAPGLDIQVMELMKLPGNIFRTSVNFMGCYAAIHALRIADSICRADTAARVMIVCTELCTLHFQKEPTQDNILSGLLFGDGAAAVLVANDRAPGQGWHMDSFYAELLPDGKKDMAWDLSSTGFLMTLSAAIPDLIEAGFASLVSRSLQHAGKSTGTIAHWCIHPGGKRILEAIGRVLHLQQQDLQEAYTVLNNYGNMSSATLLFVLKAIVQSTAQPSAIPERQDIFCAVFGPGLTIETMVLSPAQV